MTDPAPVPTLGYILKGYPRISETFISNEILLLERFGFRMRLFPMRHPRENFCHDSVNDIRAQVDYLPTELLLDFPRLLLPNIFLAVKRPSLFLKGLKLAGKRFQRTGKTATFKHLFQAGFLCHRHLLKDPSITHIHGHFAHSPTSVTMFAALLSGLPFSFTAHAKDIYTSNPEQLKEKIRLAEFVATCTEYNKRYLEALHTEQTTPIYCIYHGIDLQLFAPTTDHNHCSPPYKLFTVARMTEKKGLPTIYKALKLLQERGLEFQHTLIGDGDDREAVTALINNLSLTANCRCLGTRTHTEVLKQFEQSDLFVLGCEIAKNGDRDGIPNVLVESLAMGVPALSTTVSAVPEILVNEQTGITVPPSNPEAMANGIEKVLTDMPLRKSLIEGGREHTRQHFNNYERTRQLATVFAKHIPLPDTYNNAVPENG